MATSAILSPSQKVSSTPKIVSKIIQPITYKPVQDTRPSAGDLFMQQFGGISYSNVLPNLLGAQNLEDLKKNITEKIPFFLVGFIAVLVLILSANAFLNEQGVK